MTALSVENLRRFYNHFTSEDHVLILIDADPDAIASAMAVKRRLWRKVAGVTIARINEIKRPDNISMIQLLKVNLVSIQDIDKNSFSRFVLVDSQPNPHDIFSDFPIDAVIDHHPETVGIETRFFKIFQDRSGP